jgi:hypothetical protein
MYNDCKGFKQHKKKGTKALIDYLNRKNTTKSFDIHYYYYFIMQHYLLEEKYIIKLITVEIECRIINSIIEYVIQSVWEYE